MRSLVSNTEKNGNDTDRDASCDGEVTPSEMTEADKVLIRQRAKIEVGNLGVPDSDGFQTRQEIIEIAKQDFESLGDELNLIGLADCFDACAIAFFHEALYGKPDFKTHTHPLPLHEAISIAENGSAQLSKEECPPAIPQQVVAAASWLAESLASHAWNILPKVEDLLVSDKTFWCEEDEKIDESEVDLKTRQLKKITRRVVYYATVAVVFSLILLTPPPGRLARSVSLSRYVFVCISGRASSLIIAASLMHACCVCTALCGSNPI